jgi:hypothetical protein
VEKRRCMGADRDESGLGVGGEEEEEEQMERLIEARKSKGNGPGSMLVEGRALLI